jgi:site-specific DNA-methyltransferase (adenine-specific)
MTYQILHGNNLDILPTLADNSIDSIVTDPPYELGFMGKKWDSSGIAYSVELWQQCLRVLKPGGHLLSFGGTRTYHRVAVAIEDAGFELRDSIAWLYGSGFPKSLDVSKAIDKQSGYEGEVIGTEVIDIGMQGGSMHAGRETKLAERQIKTLSPEAQQWQGWGTALKPAFEPVIVARKPIEGTVANNVLKWGTGGLNIDGSRIGSETMGGGTMPAMASGDSIVGRNQGAERKENTNTSTGRWPANIILDPYTAELLDEQSGDRPGGNFPTQRGAGVATGFGLGKPTEGGARKMNDTGGASRFFYVAKASKRDRNEGLEGLPIRRPDDRTETSMGTFAEKGVQPAQNFHPTVKPTSLMEYLIKLVTPPNGTVLDPFTGSGSTGKAAILQGFDFIGIEMTEEYLPIIEGRLKHAEAMVAEAKQQDKLKENEVLF